MTEEKAKSLIGRKVRGFVFDGTTPIYNPKMNEFIDKIGVIVSVTDFGNLKVDFGSCDYWCYPASLIEAHLVEKGISENELNKVDSVLTEIEQLKADKEALVKAL